MSAPFLLCSFFANCTTKLHIGIVRRILIVSATAAEVSPLLSNVAADIGLDCFIIAQERNVELWCLIAGVGAAPYSYSLGRALAQKQFDFVVGVGIAGTYNPHLKLGSVVAVLTETFADYGIDDKGKFLSLFQIGLLNPSVMPYTDGVMVCSSPLCASSAIGLPVVTGITVASATGSHERIGLLSELYSADIETMEGAALFYCCLMEGLPFLSVRAISNRVEPRDRSRWQIPLAVKNLCNEVQRVVNIIDNSLGD